MTRGASTALQLAHPRAKGSDVCQPAYSAEEALTHGWVNMVVPHDQLVAGVNAWCEELLDKSPAYLELTKVTSNVWWDMLQPGMEHAKQALLALAGGEQMTEGASAFMQKRKANWRRFRK